jgi:hypothetical protein
MTVTETQPEESGVLGATDAAGDLWTMSMMDVGDLISGAESFLQAQAVATDTINEAIAGTYGAASGDIADTFTSVLNAMQAEELPYQDVGNFFRWLRYTEGQASIPASAVQGGQFNQWIVQYAGSVLGLTVPGYTPAGPPELVQPTQGTTAATKAAGQGQKVTVTGADPTSVSPEEATDALATVFVESMQVLARVIDQMLPGMAPGQVPEALANINQAVTVLEHQMTQALTDLDPNSQGSMAAQLHGALEALHGLAQEVGILAQQMAEKADSSLEDSITAQGAEIAALGAGLSALTTTTIPALQDGIAANTAAVEQVSSTVTNQVEPKLDTAATQAQDATTELSGTDKECLDQLCDAINNVTDPIKEGGATPSLLKQLGGLLGGALALGFFVNLLEDVFTIMDAKLNLSEVAQDVETLSTWADGAAQVIINDLSWQGTLVE